ncbi:MAG: hypothetical protein EBY18_15390 [Alphaproteobacteria bacterium]|nr:hypothetical protein [Alphaproteobacteria bacterium]
MSEPTSLRPSPAARRRLPCQCSRPREPATAGIAWPAAITSVRSSTTTVTRSTLAHCPVSPSRWSPSSATCRRGTTCRANASSRWESIPKPRRRGARSAVRAHRRQRVGEFEMRSLFVVIGMVVFASPASAQYSPPQWTADARTGCRVWNSSPEPGDSISWTGGCRNSLAQGQGVLQWFMDGKPGSRFEGEYRDGLLNGRGVYVFANGSRYDGEWRNGLPSGPGRLKRADGTVVSGNWTNGCLRQRDQMATFLATRKDCGFE